jgi:hypothetical protein
MALTFRKTYLHVSMVDYEGNKSAMRIELDFASLDALNTGIADITGAGGVLADLADVTDLKIISAFIGEELGDEGYGLVGAEAEETAVISAKIDGRPGVYGNLRIPGPNIDIFLPGPGSDANVLDRENAALIAWLTNFGSSGHCLTSDGESIADPSELGNFKGRRVFRHSRRRAPTA